MGRNKKRVTTTIKPDLYEFAQVRGIKLSDALEVGIRKLSGRKGESELIQERINTLEKEKGELEDKLNSIKCLDDKLDDTENIDLDCVLNKYNDIIDKGNLIPPSSIEYYAPKLGLSPNDLEEFVKNKLGNNVIENVHIPRRGDRIEGLDGSIR